MTESTLNAVLLVADKLKSLLRSTNGLLVKVEPWQLVVYSAAGTVAFIHIRRVLRRSDRPLLMRMSGAIFGLMRRIPCVRVKIDRTMASTRDSLVESIHQCDEERIFKTKLPEEGLTTGDIIALAARYSVLGNVEIDSGHVSGAVYTDRNHELILLLSQVFQFYAYSNPFHPDVFPGCRKMEAEVVRMVANLYSGNDDVCGTMTSGGTESIMLAVLAYRNKALAAGISDPEILVPITAHAAFDKAASLYAMRIRHIPVDSNNRVDVRAMKMAISSETCALVGSAPNFPSGTMDDIRAISKLGWQYGIPVHVDACLGGFLIPFMEEAGFHMPLFDFRLPGVTSISCDTHKYGYAPKGSSVVLYRSKEYLHHQYFCVPEWTGGIYATPTFAGSRCGSTIALTWATLMHFGRGGYINRTNAIILSARAIANAIVGTDGKAGVPGLRLLGPADVSVVAFTSDVFNIYVVGDIMHGLGWNLSSLQNPPALHFCVTYISAMAEVEEAFIRDLRWSVSEVFKSNYKKLEMESKTGAIYGLAASIPDKSLVSEVAFAYLDACYAMPPPTNTSEG